MFPQHGVLGSFFGHDLVVLVGAGARRSTAFDHMRPLRGAESELGSFAGGRRGLVLAWSWQLMRIFVIFKLLGLHSKTA